MSDDKLESEHEWSLPTGIPLLHGRITPEEERREAEKKERIEVRKADDSFKERQVKATEASNTLARRNVRITVLVAFISLGACVSSWYQGCQSANTLQQMRSQTKTAQRANYLSCLNNQIAQRNLLEAHKATAFSRSAAVSAFSQAQAEIATQRASVVYQIISPNPSEIEANKDLPVPFSIKNEGKVAVENLIINEKTVLLTNDDRLLFDNKGLERDFIRLLPPGGELPDKQYVNGYKPLSVFRRVKDAHGNIIPVSDKRAADFINGFDHGSTQVASYGNLQYTDFSGIHHFNFCSLAGTIKSGDTYVATKNSLACAKHNFEYSDSSSLGLIPSFPETSAATLPIVCEPPKE